MVFILCWMKVIMSCILSIFVIFFLLFILKYLECMLMWILVRINKKCISYLIVFYLYSWGFYLKGVSLKMRFCLELLMIFLRSFWRFLILKLFCVSFLWYIYRVWILCWFRRWLGLIDLLKLWGFCWLIFRRWLRWDFVSLF